MTRGAKKTLFNPNPTPLVFDGEGRTVAGGERVEVDKVDEVAQEAIDHELLVLEEPERRDEDEHEGTPPAKELPARKASGASAQGKPA